MVVRIHQGQSGLRPSGMVRFLLRRGSLIFSGSNGRPVSTGTRLQASLGNGQSPARARHLDPIRDHARHARSVSLGIERIGIVVHKVVPGNDLFIKESSPEFEQSVDAAVNKLQAIMRKAKEKQVDQWQKGG